MIKMCATEMDISGLCADKELLESPMKALAHIVQTSLCQGKLKICGASTIED